MFSGEFGQRVLEVNQSGLRDIAISPGLPIFSFKQLEFTGDLSWCNAWTNSMFINPAIQDKIYLGNLVSHNAQSNINTVSYTHLIVRFKTTPADALRISFTESKGPLCINNVEAFLAPPLLEQPYIMRNAKNEVRIGTESEGADIYYTTDGTEPTAQSVKYETPFIGDTKGTVKAITCDPQSGKTGPVGMRDVDLPATDYKVVSPVDDRTSLLFDGRCV